MRWVAGILNLAHSPTLEYSYQNSNMGPSRRSESCLKAKEHVYQDLKASSSSYNKQLSWLILSIMLSVQNWPKMSKINIAKLFCILVYLVNILYTYINSLSYYGNAYLLLFLFLLLNNQLENHVWTCFDEVNGSIIPEGSPLRVHYYGAHTLAGPTLPPK